MSLTFSATATSDQTTDELGSNSEDLNGVEIFDCANPQKVSEEVWSGSETYSYTFSDPTLQPQGDGAYSTFPGDKVAQAHLRITTSEQVACNYEADNSGNTPPPTVSSAQGDFSFDVEAGQEDYNLNYCDATCAGGESVSGFPDGDPANLLENVERTVDGESVNGAGSTGNIEGVAWSDQGGFSETNIPWSFGGGFAQSPDPTPFTHELEVAPVVDCSAPGVTLPDAQNQDLAATPGLPLTGTVHATVGTAPIASYNLVSQSFATSSTNFTWDPNTGAFSLTPPAGTEPTFTFQAMDVNGCAGNTATISVSTQPVDEHPVNLIVGLTPVKKLVEPGTVVNFVATVKNAGTNTALAVVLTVANSGPLAVSGVRIGSSNCATVADEFICTLGALKPGQSKRITFSGVLTANHASATEYVAATTQSYDQIGDDNVAKSTVISKEPTRQGNPFGPLPVPACGANISVPRRVTNQLGVKTLVFPIHVTCGLITRATVTQNLTIVGNENTPASVGLAVQKSWSYTFPALVSRGYKSGVADAKALNQWRTTVASWSAKSHAFNDDVVVPCKDYTTQQTFIQDFTGLAELAIPPAPAEVPGIASARSVYTTGCTALGSSE